MTSTDNPPPPPPLSRPPPNQRSGCVTALMAIFGIVLLLPGVCALLFGGVSVSDGGRMDSGVALLVFLGLVVGLGGVALIWAAIKGRRA